ncbi:RNase A-like domain-containing protein [Streptomyces sp. NPDC093111]|uniref:RNase A-like domain-containing protein n=1 Tax=Streptomyces sp. NPDC093111 TaxID=3154978 RepID=UPI00341AAD57
MATPAPPTGGSGNGNGNGGGNGQPNSPALPSPVPGKLTDPQGKDISQGQTKPKPDPNKEVQDLKPSVDPGGFPSGFDVDPTHVWYTSYLIRNHQTAFDRAPRNLLDTLDGHKHVCGVGSGPEAFERAYDEISGRYLDVWAVSVVAVGGVSTGLTITANNYVRAEYASNPALGTPTSLKPVPEVIRIPPDYGKAPFLGWRTGGGDNFAEKIINEALGAIGSAIQWLIREVMDKALKHGKVGQITPGGDDVELPLVAAAWRKVAQDAEKSGADLDAAIGYLRNPDASAVEWQSAMKQFTSSLWGTASWGKGAGSPVAQGYDWKHPPLHMTRQPVLRILVDIANKIAAILDSFATAVRDVRKVIEHEYIEAGKELVQSDSVKNFLKDLGSLFTGPAGLAENFLDNLNETALNAGVDRYNNRTHELARQLKELRPVLDEAQRTVPTFQAEEARAQSVGARSIEGYGTEHNWTVPGDQATNHRYPIDLANQEDMKVDNQTAHGIDRHVGLTAEQLQRRMRDANPTPPAASSFYDLNTAQQFVQSAIDRQQAFIAQKILDDPNAALQPFKVDFWPQVTGMSVTTPNGTPVPVHNVKVRLQLTDDGRQPPFIVVTAFPDSP